LVPKLVTFNDLNRIMTTILRHVVASESAAR